MSESADCGQCSHPVLFGNICIKCGAVVEEPHENLLYSSDNSLTISLQEKKARNVELEKRLINEKKLILVIDLDKTLIDTTIVQSFEEAAAIIALDQTAKPDDFVVFSIDGVIYVVRLRPNVRIFLKKLSKYFFLQVYTGSQAGYARRIVNAIDPERKLFGDRVWSITAKESERYMRENRYEKSIKNLFPASDRLVVVLDDSPDVWFTDEGNTLFKGLVQIKPFRYFIPACLTAPTSISTEGVNDNTLEFMEKLLISVNRNFYKTFNPLESHVLISLAELKASVFDRLHFLFVGCWDSSDPTDGQFYKLKAVEYGANVVDSFAPYVTHIIVGCNGADEQCRQALNYSGIRIVSYSWFEESFLHYARFDEEPFGIQGFPLPTNGFFPRDEPPNIIINSICEDDIDQMLDSDDDTYDTVPSVMALEDIKKGAGIMERILNDTEDLTSCDYSIIETGI